MLMKKFNKSILFQNTTIHQEKKEIIPTNTNHDKTNDDGKVKSNIHDALIMTKINLITT